jgi:uncharacterized membrane protein YeaQ/YmgE (transglycosylase-associated protein family)
MHLLWFLVIGLMAGWLAGKLTRGAGFGVLGDLVVGVLGAFLGGLLFRLLGLSAGGRIGSLIVATIGAVVLVYLGSSGRGHRRSRHHVDHPGQAEAVSNHAEARGEEGLAQRHLHLAAVGQGCEQALGLGIVGHGE